jgi:hypothetical protein
MDALRPYDSFRGIEPLGQTWTLKKDARTADCALTTHPLGWELKVTLGDELVRSQVCKTETSVFDTSDEWRRQWEAKGWTAGATIK